MKTVKPLYHFRKRKNSLCAPNWDYSQDGSYYITINTAHRQHYFGEVENGRMVLSVAGKINEEIWMEIPIRFPFITLGKMIVMPNHFHGILHIGKEDDHLVGARFIGPLQDDHPAKPSVGGGITGIHNPMRHQNLSTVIRWFKGRSTFEIRKHEISFYWQRGFYDHIIQNKFELKGIEDYILANPKRWKEDRYWT